MLTVLISTDTRYPVNRKIIKKAVSDTLLNNRVEGNCEVSVSVVGQRKMKDLTEKYVGDGENHEVLSFPLEDSTFRQKTGFVNVPDETLRLGDIILCWPEILLLASNEDVFVDEKVYFLTCHSVEHLLGKHHE